MEKLKQTIAELTTRKTELIQRIASDCGVSETTVYRWIAGKSEPDKLKKEKIEEILKELETK